MGLFDGFLDTASSAFNWLNDNKAALDLIGGAAKGYGAYLSAKEASNTLDFQKKQWEEQQRRAGSTPSSYNSGNYATNMATFNPGTLLNGSMANALSSKTGTQ